MTQGKWYSSRSDHNGQILYAVFVAVVIAGLLWWAWESSRVRKAIRENPRFSRAVLTRISTRHTRHGGSRMFFTYSFQTPKGLKSGSGGYSTSGRKIRLHPSCYPELVGKSFPIIYSDKYPEKPRLLLLRQDFLRYGLPFPDSLRWTEPLIYGSTPPAPL